VVPWSCKLAGIVSLVCYHGNDENTGIDRFGNIYIASRVAATVFAWGRALRRPAPPNQPDPGFPNSDYTLARPTSGLELSVFSPSAQDERTPSPPTLPPPGTFAYLALRHYISVAPVQTVDPASDPGAAGPSGERGFDAASVSLGPMPSGPIPPLGFTSTADFFAAWTVEGYGSPDSGAPGRPIANVIEMQQFRVTQR